jgi:DNA polymerase-3 subunit epsilon
MLWEGYRLLWKLIEGYQLSPKLCFVDKSSGKIPDASIEDEPALYNERVEKALDSLRQELPSFAIVGQGRYAGEKSCLLVENGRFFGMGYIPEAMELGNAEPLKQALTPYPDNDYIRGLIYRHAGLFPQTRVDFS